MNASDQCIKTRKCGNDGQSKERIMERFVKFVLFLLRLTIISVKKVTFGGISGLNEAKIDPKNAEN